MEVNVSSKRLHKQAVLVAMTILVLLPLSAVIFSRSHITGINTGTSAVRALVITSPGKLKAAKPNTGTSLGSTGYTAHQIFTVQ